MPTERWRKIAHVPHVEVSTLGRVRSSYVGQGRARDDEPKYLRLDAKGRVAIEHGKKVSAAVLVLEAFVGARPVGCVALRRDQDASNNALDNLAWATPGELAAARNPRGEAHPHHGKRLTAGGWRAAR